MNILKKNIFGFCFLLGLFSNSLQSVTYQDELQARRTELEYIKNSQRVKNSLFYFADYSEKLNRAGDYLVSEMESRQNSIDYFEKSIDEQSYLDMALRPLSDITSDGSFSVGSGPSSPERNKKRNKKTLTKCS